MRDILNALENESMDETSVAKTDSSYWKDATNLVEDTISWWSGEGGVVRQVGLAASLVPAFHMLLRLVPRVLGFGFKVSGSRFGGCI